MLDIKSIGNKSLVDKTIELAIHFAFNPSEKTNEQIGYGKEEILRRLGSFEPDTNEIDKNIITIHFGKSDLIGFKVNGSVSELDQEQMNSLRIMVCVAIANAEHMWSREQAKKFPTCTAG